MSAYGFRRTITFRNHGPAPFEGITWVVDVLPDLVSGWRDVAVAYHGRRVPGGLSRPVNRGPSIEIDVGPMAPGAERTYEILYGKV